VSRRGGADISATGQPKVAGEIGLGMDENRDKSSMTTDAAEVALGSVLEEMRRCESNLKQKLTMLKGLLHGS
jgi:hypothetical protein